MTEFQVGDLVEATHPDGRVFGGRVEYHQEFAPANVSLVIRVSPALFCDPRHLEANGFTLAVQTAPRIQFPTEPGWYFPRPDFREQQPLHFNGKTFMRRGLLLTSDEARNLLPFTRLVPEQEAKREALSDLLTVLATVVGPWVGRRDKEVYDGALGDARRMIGREAARIGVEL